MPAKLLLILLVCIPVGLRAQDSLTLYEKVHHLPDKFFGFIHRKSASFQRALLKSSLKYISRLEKQELKMKRALAKKDTAAAAELFGDVQGRYASLRNQLEHPAADLQQLYSPRLDSLQTGLRFLQQVNIAGESGEMQHKIQSALGEYGNIQSRLNQTDFIEKQLQERQAYLMNRLQSSALIRPLHVFEAKVYYYRAQLDEYRQRWEDPAKVESMVLGALAKLPAFSNFFNRYSQLGSLFQLPGNTNVSAAAVNGMQTRQMLDPILNNQFGGISNVQNAINNGVQDVGAVLQRLKNTANELQANGSFDMPDFRPNTQKTKSIWKRIETGINIQSTKSSFFLPVTTDIALSMGYKLTSEMTAGIGGSYKVGWGKDIRHISLTHEGIGLRSFYEFKLKRRLWLSGGWEMNYLSAFHHFDELKNMPAWQHSALIGVSKKYKIKKYNGEINLLYDLLWNKHIPAGQPIIFRTGYKF